MTPKQALRRPDLDEVRAAVASVPDPELPPVSVGMLGMVHDVAVRDGGEVEVELLPTWSGCPATEMIARDVETAVRAVDGVTGVEVRFRFDPPWSSARITEQGRDALASFGIAPPLGETAPPQGARRLPLVAAPARPRPCPFCGSLDTVLESPFGPTPCRTIDYCQSCRNPFESFKDL